jgi:dipeptidyl aminopeptidase/acylaminoacyl peptidase
MFRLTFWVGLAVAMGLVGWASAAPPVEDFFRPYAFDEVKVSPDGTKVAVLSTWKDFRNLYVIDLKTKRPLQLTGLDYAHVIQVRWVGNDRLLFSTEQDGSPTGGLFAINADGRHARTLAESAQQQGARGGMVFRYARFLDYLPDDDSRILVVANDRSEFDPDVYTMNVRSGRKRLVARNPMGVRHWVADSTGAVRLAFGEQGRRRFVLHRATDRDEWQQVREFDFMDGQIIPLTFAAGDRECFVLASTGTGRAAVRRFDPVTGELGEVIFADEVYDAAHVLQSRHDRRLLGVAYEAERWEVAWQDEGMRRLQELLDLELPDTRNTFYSRSDDERWYVILASSDRHPGTFYLLDTQEMTMETLVSRADWLKKEELAEMRPISYVARDGLTIHGYLTLPVGMEAKNLPLVVNPHGGPWVRDSWGFDPEVQFLASRGYAVLRMNFRGSTGYGGHHLQAGYGQWGLAMQDDITDGVKWAIAEGIADPARIAIYGASYGGYAAMAGLAFTPELYRCGVNYVGVTDVALLQRTVPRAWESIMEQLEDMTGDRKRDRERLEAASPLENADRIRAPVFFAYGELDDRVDMRHGTRMAATLRRNGVTVEWMLRSDEGHGFRKWDNKISFYRTMERFLAEHMQ